jgi:hypothetical protein
MFTFVFTRAASSSSPATSFLEVHAAPHPARPGRARRDAGALGGAKAASADERARSSLLAALDAEGEDDELDDAGGADRGEARPIP